MRQIWTIALNAFMELVRQPIFLLLMTAASSFCLFLSSVFYFGLGDDAKMTKDSVLAVLFLAGLFCTVLSASASVAQEIRMGTALAVLSKPVGRASFLIAKYLGLAGALALFVFCTALAALLSSRMAFDSYGSPDKIALGIYFGFLLLAYAMGGFTNYFLRRNFIPDAVLFVVVNAVLAFVLINFVSKDGEWQAFGTGIDWRLIPLLILILFALWILAGIALVCSTRLETIPTLAICSALFLVGLMSDYFFGRAAAAGSWWAVPLYTIVPNWQLVWLADALETGKTIPWRYVGSALLYVAGYLGACLCLALLLFEDRELN